MAISGWLLDKSAAARAGQPGVGQQLDDLAGHLFVCPVGELEQLYSARSARDYDDLKVDLHLNFEVVAAPRDLLEKALALQRDLAHHHGMWHRTAIPDLLIAEVALHHYLGVVHVDGDYERIAEVRPLVSRRLSV
ncbi:MAG: VapC toxin family PIN domain ribonuclease [Acidimicrobiales bacterium]|nr:MAG: VapC toxin family PIN domain ribonuclease [Acidimicrobiales bacterium]